MAEWEDRYYPFEWPHLSSGWEHFSADSKIDRKSTLKKEKEKKKRLQTEAPLLFHNKCKAITSDMIIQQ